MSRYQSVVDRIVESESAIGRYKALVHVVGVDQAHPDVVRARLEIRSSPIARALLSDVTTEEPAHRAGFSGTYMTLRHLADVEYPAGDTALLPYRDHVYAWLRSEEQRCDELFIKGKFRVHGSFHGNAIYSSIALGLANEETDRLCQKLLQYQWPGGGWNCKKLPRANGPCIVHTALYWEKETLGKANLLLTVDALEILECAGRLS